MPTAAVALSKMHLSNMLQQQESAPWNGLSCYMAALVMRTARKALFVAVESSQAQHQRAARGSMWLPSLKQWATRMISLCGCSCIQLSVMFTRQARHCFILCNCLKMAQHAVNRGEGMSGHGRQKATTVNVQILMLDSLLMVQQ